MKLLRKLMNHTGLMGPTEFDRYYGGILRAGTGYPTAAEARRDRRIQDRNLGNFPNGWPV